MKLSSRERFGLRAMVEFARRYGQGPTPLSEVARAQELSLSYLEHIVASLRRAGLLESIRGAHGGYVLAKDPAKISVGDVFRAVEGCLMPLDCMRTDGTNCAREPVCATRSVWQLISERLKETLDNTSLADLLEQCRSGKDPYEKATSPFQRGYPNSF
ncbi:MAG: Rrf2 family transcriptional regulator [Anaerolineae bacterium]|nr:Rrf2 family transcriptional regulator [Anaerolineae bacterium]